MVPFVGSKVRQLESSVVEELYDWRYLDVRYWYDTSGKAYAKTTGGPPGRKLVESGWVTLRATMSGRKFWKTLC